MASPLTFKCHMLRARNNVHEIPYHVSRTLVCQKQGGSCEETTRHGTVEAVSKNWTQKYANGTADVDKSCAIRNARYRQPGEIIGRVSRNPDNICFPVSSRVYQGVMLLFSLSLSLFLPPTNPFVLHSATSTSNRSFEIGHCTWKRRCIDHRAARSKNLLLPPTNCLLFINVHV